MDGEVYDGIVKGKEKAQQQYTEAVSRGESAGIVRSGQVNPSMDQNIIDFSQMFAFSLGVIL